MCVVFLRYFIKDYAAFVHSCIAHASESVLPSLSGYQWDAETLRILAQAVPRFNVAEKIM